jgi:hypothetical protein
MTEWKSLAGIKRAVLDTVSDKIPPEIVATLLLKISAEITMTTYTLPKDEWLELAEGVWQQARDEHLDRLLENCVPD